MTIPFCWLLVPKKSRRQQMDCQHFINMGLYAALEYSTLHSLHFSCLLVFRGRNILLRALYFVGISFHHTLHRKLLESEHSGFFKITLLPLKYARKQCARKRSYRNWKKKSTTSTTNIYYISAFILIYSTVAHQCHQESTEQNKTWKPATRACRKKNHSFQTWNRNRLFPCPFLSFHFYLKSYISQLSQLDEVVVAVEWFDCFIFRCIREH